MALQQRRLILAGFASAGVYLASTWRLPWWTYGGTLQSWPQLLGADGFALGSCLVGIGVLVAAYLWGWSVVRGGGGSRWVIWSFAGLFGLTLFWLQPITSDLFSYLSRAHLFTDLGGNPMVDAPLDFRDALVQAYPAAYATRPTVYGPAWLLMAAPATLGRYDVLTGLVYLKGLAVLAYLGCAWCLEQILRQLRPAATLEGLYLFAWNPLVLLMAVGDGHNDIVMMALVLLSLWLLLREAWLPSCVALTLSVWIKYVSVIFIPLFALFAWQRLGRQRRQRLWSPLAWVGLAASVSVLLFLPFGGLGQVTGLVERVLWPANWRVGAAYLSAWTLGIGIGLFALAYAVLVWRAVGGGCSFQQLGNACFSATVLAFFLGAARSQSWHLIWPAALAGVSDRRWAWPLVVGLSVIMLAVQLWAEWGGAGVRLF